jgi:hypothetical protein
MRKNQIVSRQKQTQTLNNKKHHQFKDTNTLLCLNLRNGC